jgi:NADPH:quinone reductase
VRNAGRADEVINTEKEDLAARVKEITGGKGADAAVDPVGGALTGQVSRIRA